MKVRSNSKVFAWLKGLLVAEKSKRRPNNFYSPVFPTAALTSDHEPFVIGVSFHCTSNIYLALEGFQEGRRT